MLLDFKISMFHLPPWSCSILAPLAKSSKVGSLGFEIEAVCRTGVR